MVECLSVDPKSDEDVPDEVAKDNTPEENRGNVC